MDEQKRIAQVLETYEHWNRGDVDAIVADIPLEFEFHTNVEVPGLPSIVRGPEELRRFFHAWYEEPWEGNLEIAVDRIFILDDDRALCTFTFIGAGRGSGVPVEVRYCHLLTFRDDVNVRIDGFPGWSPGFRAAGLDPDDPPDPDWQRETADRG